MYDNVCRFLAEHFQHDLSKWLLGESISWTELSPTELSLEPIRADSMILQQSKNLILHGEFQTQPLKEIFFRMIDYRIRGYRIFPDKEMRQVVIYLRKTNSPLVRQNYFRLKKTFHEFEVIRLWEETTETFLDAPGLLPFAVLSKTKEPEMVLNRVKEGIEDIKDTRTQNSVTAASAILAGLVLKENVIKKILRRDIMRESVIYQEILQEGRLEGKQEGLKQGMDLGVQFAKKEVALNLLREQMAPETVVRLTGLSLKEVLVLQGER